MTCELLGHLNTSSSSSGHRPIGPTTKTGHLVLGTCYLPQGFSPDLPIEESLGRRSRKSGESRTLSGGRPSSLRSARVSVMESGSGGGGGEREALAGDPGAGCPDCREVAEGVRGGRRRGCLKRHKKKCWAALSCWYAGFYSFSLSHPVKLLQSYEAASVCTLWAPSLREGAFGGGGGTAAASFVKDPFLWLINRISSSRATV